MLMANRTVNGELTKIIELVSLNFGIIPLAGIYTISQDCVFFFIHKSCIHCTLSIFICLKDLAARNVMLSNNNVCKVRNMRTSPLSANSGLVSAVVCL